MRLADFVKITTGPYVPSHPVGDGETAPPDALGYFQLSDFTEDGQRTSSIPRAYLLLDDSVARPPYSLLEANNILLSARGARLFAALVPVEWLPAAASNSFFVLEVNARVCLPAFLLAILNLPDTKARLRGRLSGAAQVVLNKRDLLDFEPLPEGAKFPSLAHQHFLADLYQLWLREKSLTQDYLNHLETYLTGRITHLIRHPNQLPETR